MNECVTKKCWICNNIMEYLEIVEIQKITGKFKKYKCPKCGEIIYSSLNK